MYRLMIVEDEQAIHRSLRKLVETSGMDIRIEGEAEDGAEALAMLEETAPDIVVTDIRMPEMDGLAFIKAAREAHPRIRFIILTGYERFDYAREALRYGVSEFLLKPVDPDQFLHTLAKLLGELAHGDSRVARQSEWLLRHQQRVKELAERLWAVDTAGAADKIREDLADYRDSAGDDLRMGRWALDLLRAVDGELARRGFGIPKAPSEEELPEREQECPAWALEACRQRIAEIKGSRNFGSRYTMGKAARYIQENCTREDLSLKDVAEWLGMSVPYLSRSFKEEIGVTFVKYLIGVRMDMAARLLRETSVQTTEAAFRVGFSDYVHFSKTFKKHFGLTPSEFRKQLSSR
ncbi:response regulator transcription factor [Cohnella nanjingensis]|uniref:Response regulator n=1 Tax=Cohnella nanjingensis TaxID=1387779 RepID=A0A7X0RPB3_9BACL|nr:response regulator [Cohnella nanjingensis]MBB6671208.1 response regulator [Cohnella nanjingensis]